MKGIGLVVVIVTLSTSGLASGPIRKPEPHHACHVAIREAAKWHRKNQKLPLSTMSLDEIMPLVHRISRECAGVTLSDDEFATLGISMLLAAQIAIAHSVSDAGGNSVNHTVILTKQNTLLLD